LYYLTLQQSKVKVTDLKLFKMYRNLKRIEEHTQNRCSPAARHYRNSYHIRQTNKQSQNWS